MSYIEQSACLYTSAAEAEVAVAAAVVALAVVVAVMTHDVAEVDDLGHRLACPGLDHGLHHENEVIGIARNAAGCVFITKNQTLNYEHSSMHLFLKKM